MPEDNPILAAVEALDAKNVEYVLVGGAAVNLHGSAYMTQDVDFACSWESGNVERIAEALNTLHPRLRVQGIPEGHPCHVDARLLKNGTSFAFITDIGNLDIRFHVDGIGNYQAVLDMSEEDSFGDRKIRLLTLDGIIQSKKHMGRPRDLQILPELELMRETRRIEKLEKERG